MIILRLAGSDPCFYSTLKKKNLQMREARKLKTCGPGVWLESTALLIAGIGAADESGHVGVELLERGVVDVDHVSGFIPVVLNVLCKLG